MDTKNIIRSSISTLDKTVEIGSDTVSPVVNPVVDSLKNDLAKKIVSDSWKQLLHPELIGVNEEPAAQGDLQEGEFLDFAGKTAKEQKPQITPAINYSGEFQQNIEIVREQGENATKSRVQEIIVELAQVKNSSREVEQTVKDINFTLQPRNPGVYDLGFFEKIRSIVGQAQVTAENSANWIAAVTIKSSRKIWDERSQHGRNTAFTLSGERTAATSSVG
jgi:hypothetical protein